MDDAMQAQGRQPDPAWCDVCGEGRQACSEITYEWGVREEAGLEVWTSQSFDTTGRVVRKEPHTEESARQAVRNGYLYGWTLIRRAAGCGVVEVVAYEPAVLPAPTDEDLQAERHGGVMLAGLGEDGEYVIALGHIHPPEMAQAASLRAKSGWAGLGGDVLGFTKDDVEHVQALRVEGWGYDCAWGAGLGP